MSDDERANYLSGDVPRSDLPVDERVELDEVRALLADATVWASPPDDLEDAVVAAVSAEVTQARRRDRGRRLQTRARRWLVAAAAAAVVAVALVAMPSSNDEPAPLQAALSGTGFGRSASGQATFMSTESGWRIELDAAGLPRRDGGRFYEAWLRDTEGRLVSVGTFNEPDDVVLWAGVSPHEFSTITVTEGSVAEPASESRRRVLSGPIVER